MSNYTQAIDSLTARGLELVQKPGTPRRKFDLAHMRTLMAALGNPQNTYPSVLIAGTNGKGSTAATIAAIFSAAGYRTGLYTSPHLVHPNERIQISANPAPADGPLLTDISNDDFARLYFQVDNAAESLVASQALPHHPSFFEVLTAIAFCRFAEQKIQLAVLEVGLGGRLDATNIVEPTVSVLTDISLDHTDWLGSTITEIAREKAGILRPNGFVVTLPQHPDANTVIGNVAAELNVTGISATDFIPQRHLTSDITAAITPQRFRNQYPLALGNEVLAVDSPLYGAHQQRNIALAIATAATLAEQLSLPLTTEQIALGIRRTHWPARLELFTPQNSAPVLLDVAHNPAGAWTLRSAISSLPELPRTLIFGCLADKPLQEMMQILFPLFDEPGTRILLTPADSQRAASLETLAQAAQSLGYATESIPTAADALTRAQQLTPHNGIIIATGSLYLVGALRALITQQA